MGDIWIYPVVGLALAAIIPARRVPVVSAAVLLAVAWLFFELSRPHALEGSGAGLGLAILMIVVPPPVVALCCRILWVISQSGEKRLPPGSWWPLTGSVGILLAAFAFFGLGGALAGLASPGFAYLAVLLATAATIVIAVRFWRKPPGGAVGSHARALATAAAGGLVAATVWSLSMPFTVAAKAIKIAGDNPFCIQVGGQHNPYRPAESMLDFSPLGMRASRREFHAMMIVSGAQGPIGYNWSYIKSDFKQIRSSADRYTDAFLCRPEPDFAGRLPVFSPGKGRTETFFQIADQGFIIPAAFRPKGGDFGSGSFRLSARFPDFDLAPKGERIPWTGDDWITVSDAEYLMQRRPWLLAPRGSEEDAGIEFGLMKAIIKDGAVYRSPGDALATTIQCRSLGPIDDRRCTHYFRFGQVIVEFVYPETEVPNWREHQDGVVALLRRFEAPAR